MVRATGTVGAIVLGAAVSLVSTMVRRWEWRREQRVKIHMEVLPAVRREIYRLQIGAEDPIVDPGKLAASTAHDLCIAFVITSVRDRRFALSLAEAAREVESIGGHTTGMARGSQQLTNPAFTVLSSR